MKPIKNCLICNKEVVVRHHSRLERTKYCSFACKYISNQKPKIKINCENCNKEYLCYPSNTNRKLCSMNCKNEWQSSNKGPLVFYQTATYEQKMERLKALLEKKIIKNGDQECWGWKGSKDKDGYGRSCYENKSIGAHVASWLVYKSPIVNNLWVLHTCDNRECVNPNHLYLGTAKNNSDDMIKRKRNKHPLGEQTNCNKLTKDDVIEIRKLLKIGLSQCGIAKKYKVAQATIWRIKEQISWDHIEEEKS